MKILKSFIILFGLITLAHTNINAQKAPASVNVTMQFNEEDWYASVPTEEEYLIGTGQMRFNSSANITLTSNLSRELVLVVRYEEIGGAFDEWYISEAPTKQYQPDVTLSTEPSMYGQNVELYLECGYYDNNGIYQKDGGCTVIIHPDGTVTEGGN